MAQIVNVIAPILTRGDDLLKQSIYYAFRMIAQRGHGLALQPAVTAPTYDASRYGPVPTLDAAAVLNDDELSVFLVNRNIDEDLCVTISFSDALQEVISAEILSGAGAAIANTWDEPDLLVSEPFNGLAINDGAITATLPPMSCVAATLRVS